MHLRLLSNEPRAAAIRSPCSSRTSNAHQCYSNICLAVFQMGKTGVRCCPIHARTSIIAIRSPYAGVTTHVKCPTAPTCGGRRSMGRSSSCIDYRLCPNCKKANGAPVVVSQDLNSCSTTSNKVSLLRTLCYLGD